MNLTDEELEEIARGATPGPWDHGKASLGDRVGADCDADGWTIIAESPCPRSPQKSSRSRQWHANAAHIAAFNPAQCLALLARLKAAEGALKPFAEDHRRWLVEDPDYAGREFTCGELGDALRVCIAAGIVEPVPPNGAGSGGQHEPL